jgi:ABC-2 type transport system ATP-binding protein
LPFLGQKTAGPAAFPGQKRARYRLRNLAPFDYYLGAMTILRFESVEKSLPFGFWLRKKEILRGVSLSVQQGEIYGFLGPNGAGKTTSIKCLLGLLYPDAGWVELFGERGDPGPTLAARRRLGYLPEQPYFYPHLKGRELLEYFGRLFGQRGAPLRKKAGELLEEVGLAGEGEKLLGQYSKGMLQRLGVAQALINDPDLVVFDEPMTGLDPIGRRHVKELIMAVKERGATVFFSSHILSDAEALCDRVGLLVGGQLRLEATLDDLLGERVDYWQAACEGLAPAALPGYTPRATQGNICFYHLDDDEAVDRWVDAVRKAGGSIYRVTPQRATLEDYFVATVGEQRQPSGGAPADREAIDAAAHAAAEGRDEGGPREAAGHAEAEGRDGGPGEAAGQGGES